MAEALDWAKLRLDYLKASVDAKVALMKAYADYDYRMMEVLEKRIQVEKDAVKLRQMADAFKDFKRARSGLLRSIRVQEGKRARTTTSLKYLHYLQRGETLPDHLVAWVWVGFNYFLNNLPVDDEMELASLPITEEHRRGDHFSHNLHPEESCESAPETIRHIRSLIDFLRTRNYIPKLGTPPYFLFLQVIGILVEHAGERNDAIEQRIAESKAELQELRAADWTTIDINKEPKDAEDAEEAEEDA